MLLQTREWGMDIFLRKPKNIIKSKRSTKISVLCTAVIVWFKMTHGLMTSVTRIA
ncbi:unnamed protein product [Acanthoscelides obtectus]|uniref:Uncharacterized protein n=1 Tax=Acanthoscelides obtectus TaxID=200917 RepID=A0A9P0P2P3_ACAOB|nr:unnamed protein product [Acanthoscelides obtectus]CAK1652065.1 hypothetical protein AOBTE_LOCUS17654 [Acanthoscelides obtectus]